MNALSLPPVIRAARSELSARGASEWMLWVRWEFLNPAQEDVCIVFDPPMTILLALPLLIDHTARLDTAGTRPNLRADLRLIAVPANGGTAQEDASYPLLPPASWTEVEVIGRFGYGHVSADARPDRAAVVRWQRVIDSDPFIIRMVRAC